MKTLVMKRASRSFVPHSPRRILGFLVVSVLVPASLSACAMPPSPQASATPLYDSASMNADLLKSVNQIAQVTDNIRAASGTSWAPGYDGFPMNKGDLRPHGSTAASMAPSLPAGSPLSRKVYVQWSGSAATFLQSLAGKMGDRFVARLGGTPVPDVAVYSRDQSVVEILRTVAQQLPDNYVVQVNPGEIVLKVEGF
ncbi:DotD/TraH family lipoprotein [Acidithiobacillus sp. IBUN Pt1247-S3]|uniref:DotD/TraH family lipoprotein n=1 Tax=Acidithiobacillus sp. IBUN Pt1247-S3 TaxID=3166642 RepID=UPI0034E5DADA